MRALKAKLNSRRGASLLLALLFFLIALLVGASILMAAASNGGKAKSNRDEQQAYLTLSSALQLVVDEITSEVYKGKYSYTSDGPWWNRRYYYTQQEGECTSRFLTPFLPEFNQWFNDKCLEKKPNGTAYIWTSDDSQVPKRQFPATQLVSQTFTLTVSGGEEYQAITAETVKVELTMNSDFTIQVTATITEGNFKDYSMVADFTAEIDKNFSALSQLQNQNSTFELITWKLGKMVKGWAS